MEADVQLLFKPLLPNLPGEERNSLNSSLTTLSKCLNSLSTWHTQEILWFMSSFGESLNLRRGTACKFQISGLNSHLKIH